MSIAPGRWSASGSARWRRRCRPAPCHVQYKLDRQALGTVHLNAIVRIYGEHGNELLELLAKNPAGALPVVRRRLQQKDAEWRKARQGIARHWKELLEK